MAKTYIENLLGEHERILLTSRQHWFILASSIFFEVIVILIVFGGTIFASISAVAQVVLIAIVGFLLLLIPLASMIHDILVWSNHQYIVTNFRVLQISGIINKNVIDSSLEKVNDVKMTQSVFGRLFGYGDVEILTASELGVNAFKRIEDPVHFKTAMLNAKGSLERAQSQVVQALPDFTGLITQLDTLRKQGIISEEEFQAKKTELLNKI
jgi:uncharacterized membrane protein YdbT with pleckstrin-like domain